MEIVRKTTAAKVGAAAGNTVEAIVSTATVDRDNEIILPSAFAKRLANYQRNPVHIWMHDPSVLDNYLGKAIEVEVVESGLRAVFEYAVEQNPQAKKAFDLVSSGVLNCFSVGFMPYAWVRPSDVNTLPASDQAVLAGADLSEVSRIYTDVELREISLVGIPSNTGAFVVGRSAKESKQMKKSKKPALLVRKMDVDINDICQRLRGLADSLAMTSVYDAEPDDMQETADQVAAILEGIGESVRVAFAAEEAEGDQDHDDPAPELQDGKDERDELDDDDEEDEEDDEPQKRAKAGRAISAQNFALMQEAHDHMRAARKSYKCAMKCMKSLMSVVGQPETSEPVEENEDDDYEVTDAAKSSDVFAQFLKSFR